VRVRICCSGYGEVRNGGDSKCEEEDGIVKTMKLSEKTEIVKIETGRRLT
jgi:hypothetical protein